MTSTGLWSLREWRLAYPAASVSRLGDLVFDVTVVLWITTDLGQGASWKPAAVSAAFIAGAVPALLVAPFAGSIVDRVDKRRMLIVSNLIQSAAVASLLALALVRADLPTGVLMIWVLAAILVTSSADQFVLGGRLAMIAKTIPGPMHTQAFSVQNSTYSILSLVGPPLAAPLLFGVGVWSALLLDAGSFLVSAALLARCRWDSYPKQEQEKTAFGRSLSDGWRMVLANRVMRTMVLTLVGFTFASGVMNVLEVFFVTQVLNARASLLGVLLLFYAAGTLAGSVIAPRVERLLGPEKSFAGGMVLGGVLAAGFSTVSSVPVALGFAFLMAVPVGVVTTVLIPLFIRSVPADALGRASAALNSLPALAGIVAMAVTGWLETSPLTGIDFRLLGVWFGPVNTLFLGAALLMVLAGMGAQWSLMKASRVVIIHARRP